MASIQEHLTPAGKYNTRVGVVLFLIYLAIYATFVWMSAFRPDVMARPFWEGVNLAVVYGFSLIGLAFAMSILYLLLCRRTDGNGGGGDREGGAR